MRRPLATLLLLSLSAAPLHAQSVSFGVLAGASLSTFSGDLIKDAKQHAGFIVGGFVRLGALGFAVQPGVYYTAKGAKTSDYSETGNTGSKTSLDYIQIPLVLRIKLGPLYVGGGPAIGVKLNCMNTIGAGSSTSCNDAAGAKSTEVSGIGEAGIEMGKLSLGLRADLGLTNALEAVQSGNSSALGVKTKTLSAVLMLRF